MTSVNYLSMEIFWQTGMALTGLYQSEHIPTVTVDKLYKVAVNKQTNKKDLDNDLAVHQGQQT